MLTFKFIFGAMKHQWSCEADNLTEALDKFKKRFPSMGENDILSIQTN